MNNEKLYKFDIVSLYTGQLIREVIGTKTTISDGKTYIYDKSEVVAIIPREALIMIEIFVPKSDSEKALEVLKNYSKQ